MSAIETWNKHRRNIKLLVVFMVFCFFAVFFTAGYLENNNIINGKSDPVLHMIASIGPWFLIFVISWSQVFKFKCPQCGKKFYGNSLGMFKFSVKKCVNCGSERA
jgi:hypothetical protein